MNENRKKALMAELESNYEETGFVETNDERKKREDYENRSKRWEEVKKKNYKGIDESDIENWNKKAEWTKKRYKERQKDRSSQPKKKKKSQSISVALITMENERWTIRTLLQTMDDNGKKLEEQK